MNVSDIAITRYVLDKYPGSARYIMVRGNINPMTNPEDCFEFARILRDTLPFIFREAVSMTRIPEDYPRGDMIGDIPAILHRGADGHIEATIALTSWDQIRDMLRELAEARKELEEYRRVLTGQEQPPESMRESIEITAREINRRR